MAPASLKNTKTSQHHNPLKRRFFVGDKIYARRLYGHLNRMKPGLNRRCKFAPNSVIVGCEVSSFQLLLVSKIFLEAVSDNISAT